MDLLRLPPPLRRMLFSQRSGIFITFHRRLSTATDAHSHESPFNAELDEPDLNLEDLSPNALLRRPNKKIPTYLKENFPLTLSSSNLNSYGAADPPNLSQLKQAASYFHRYFPTILYSSPIFRLLPPSSFPEVAFLGRSNVGKSSLLNALFGRPGEKPAHVSKRPGRTRTINGFGIGSPPPDKRVEEKWRSYARGGLVVVDMPGYGAGSQAEWGGEIMKYLTQRKQLRRSYILIDVEHGLKKSDIQLLLSLREEGVPHQIILSKVDKLLMPVKKNVTEQRMHNGLTKLAKVRWDTLKEIEMAALKAWGRSNGGGMSREVLCVSGEESWKGRMIGVDEVRWSVLTACGLEGIAEKMAVKKAG